MAPVCPCPLPDRSAFHCVTTPIASDKHRWTPVELETPDGETLVVGIQCLSTIDHIDLLTRQYFIVPLMFNPTPATHVLIVVFESFWVKLLRRVTSQFDQLL